LTIVKEDTICYKCNHFRDLKESDDIFIRIAEKDNSIPKIIGVCKHATEKKILHKLSGVPFFCFLNEEACGKNGNCPSYEPKEMVDITGLWEE
jgi:hypothetical protein